MTVRIALVLLALLVLCGICHGSDDRWVNFAEDGDLRYYLDQKSIHALPDNVYLFWIKFEAKDKAYFKTEYNVGNLAYILTNYELDCATSAYRVRSTILFDKNKKEIRKTVSASGEAVFEPVQPESVMELAQQEICAKTDDTTGAEADDVVPAVPNNKRSAAPPAATVAQPPSLSSDVGPEEFVPPATPFQPAVPPGVVELPPAAAELPPAAEAAPPEPPIAPLPPPDAGMPPGGPAYGGGPEFGGGPGQGGAFGAPEGPGPADRRGPGVTPGGPGGPPGGPGRF